MPVGFTHVLQIYDYHSRYISITIYFRYDFFITILSPLIKYFIKKILFEKKLRGARARCAPSKSAPAGCLRGVLTVWKCPTSCTVVPMLIISLWPSDALWRHTFGSTLAQVMACYLVAPSHYLTNVD